MSPLRVRDHHVQSRAALALERKGDASTRHRRLCGELDIRAIIFRCSRCREAQDTVGRTCALDGDGLIGTGLRGLKNQAEVAVSRHRELVELVRIAQL